MQNGGEPMYPKSTEQLAPKSVKEITTRILTEFGLATKLKVIKFSYKVKDYGDDF